MIVPYRHISRFYVILYWKLILYYGQHVYLRDISWMYTISVVKRFSREWITNKIGERVKSYEIKRYRNKLLIFESDTVTSRISEARSRYLIGPITQNRRELDYGDWQNRYYHTYMVTSESVRPMHVIRWLILTSLWRCLELIERITLCASPHDYESPTTKASLTDLKEPDTRKTSRPGMTQRHTIVTSIEYIEMESTDVFTRKD